jgi:tRNA(His) 5'-end guanylyltransferase
MFDALGDRMKNNYENRYRFYLTRRTPVIIRIDGNAFHTFTKGLERPFDADFMWAMQQTCLNLCKNIQGCVGGYVQSDEISLLLIDYQNLDSDAWFDYNLQKITSIAAARATMIFNAAVDEGILSRVFGDYAKLWESKRHKAMFDARAFNVPKEEVCNYFIWRQKDATRNSIQSVGQAYFSHKELEGKSQSDIQEMLFQKQGINWNAYSIPVKRGSFVRRYESTIEREDGSVVVSYPWYIDTEMPILTEDRNYINDLVYIGE